MYLYVLVEITLELNPWDIGDFCNTGTNKVTQHLLNYGYKTKDG